MIYQNLTSPSLGGLNRATPVVLPIAAIEQHGPHLPLATDSFIAEYFCRLLDSMIEDSVLILPVVRIGCSQHHMAFAGTLTVSHETFVHYVMELLRSIHVHGFRNFIILNSHGGNQGVGTVILEQFGAQHPECRAVFITWWKLIQEQLLNLTETGFGGVGHACELETSLMLEIAPELVNVKKMEDGEHRATFPWAETDMLRPPQASIYRSMQQMTGNGIYGKPSLASAAKGRMIGEAVVQMMSTIVRDMLETPIASA